MGVIHLSGGAGAQSTREMLREMFSHEFNVKLRHTDAAGVAFFASYFTIAHDVYELALTSLASLSAPG